MNLRDVSSVQWLTHMFQLQDLKCCIALDLGNKNIPGKQDDCDKDENINMNVR